MICLITILFFAWYFFGSVSKNRTANTFIIPQNKIGFNLIENLYKEGFIKNKKASQFLYTFIFNGFEIQDGGYYLSSASFTWDIFKKLELKKPDLVWININFCPRKEQIGEILKNNLNWTESDLNIWNSLYKETDYFEGVYYPDTYLIPVNEKPENVASRFINRFNEKFAIYQNKFLEKNIKWTTGLKIASLIGKEAGGTEDSKIVSSVIWNRLDKGMKLQIDATMQYTLGKNENGKWWGPISLEEKQSDYTYNTYR